MSKDIQELTTTLSFELGQSMGNGLFRNYPDGFNEEIPKLAERLYKKGYRKLPKDKPPLLSDGLSVEVSPALVARDSEVWAKEGKLFTIETEYMRKMGLPPFSRSIKGKLIFCPSPKGSRY